MPGNATLPGSPAASPEHPPVPVDSSRLAQLFLTALWGDVATVEAMPGAQAPGRLPRLSETRFSIPDMVSAQSARAAAAHAGAHLAFSHRSFDTGSLKARQRVLVEVIEDARVEALAIERFPGLRRLWRSQLHDPAEQAQGFERLVVRLVRALLDPEVRDDDLWVAKGHRLFYSARDRWEDPQLAYDLGMSLANDIGQMRLVMNEGAPFSAGAYRDDNQHLWVKEEALSQDDGTPDVIESVGVHSVRLREEDEGITLALSSSASSDPAAGFYVEPVAEDAALEYRNEQEAVSAVETLRYPEWDYRIQRLKQDWVSLREAMAEGGGGAVADHVLNLHRHVIERLHRQIAAVRYQSRRRLRYQLEGDELDPDGLIANAIALRAGEMPDHRIYTQHHLHSEQELALLVLLDLSESTNDTLRDDPGRSVLDVTREASIVLSDALSRLGHHFAIHGFNSDGRHAVRYQRLLDFNERFGPEQRGRFGAMRGAFSTRMGAAIRHATGHLSVQPGEHRLLLVITDGEPSDVDVHDGRMLIEDARHAVFGALEQGIVPFCLSLDPQSDGYVSHIFGPARYAILEHVGELPAQLPNIYFRLTRRYLS